MVIAFLHSVPSKVHISTNDLLVEQKNFELAFIFIDLTSSPCSF